MEFSLDRFYQLNRKAIIWIALFGLIYLLRDFFTLIFLTFILSFFGFPASAALTRRLRLPQSISVTLVYTAIFVSYIALYILVLPNVVNQAMTMRKNLPRIHEKLNELRVSYTKRFPNAAGLFNFEVESPLLQKEEIQNWHNFLERLHSSDTLGLSEQYLPDDLIKRINIYLSEQEQTATRTPPPGPSTDTSPPANPLSPADPGPTVPSDLQEDVVQALNRQVIDNRKFYTREQPYSDKTILGRFPEIQQLLTERNPHSLPHRAIQKLNRATLERHFEFIFQENYQTERKINQWIAAGRDKLQEYLPNIALYLLRFFWNSVLAILFSFLIVFDYARLSQEVHTLAHSSRLSDFFVEAGQPVVRFAISVGEGFKAIVVIAFITTLMVIPTLVLLDIPSVAFLAVLAFVTSLVPVIGLIFEMVPVALVALNEHGLERAIWSLVALGVIHFIIGYVVTPLVYGRRFKINLVAVLFILFIGNQIAGVWGMILGVPVANYLLRDVLGVPAADDKGGKTAITPASDGVASEDQTTTEGSIAPPEREHGREKF